MSDNQSANFVLKTIIAAHLTDIPGQRDEAASDLMQLVGSRSFKLGQEAMKARAIEHFSNWHNHQQTGMSVEQAIAMCIENAAFMLMIEEPK